MTESEGRFAFGANWRKFLATLDTVRIQRAESSLLEMLRLETLSESSFLDIGCGSGLFSLAARRLGTRVRSFDYDPESVACAYILRERYFPQDPVWTIETGSALDAVYMNSIGRFDIVYSWGVLHHTGDLWRALDLAEKCVAPGGRLFIAIYNDQGWRSRVWLRVKRAYVAGGAVARRALLLGSLLLLWGPTWLRELYQGRPGYTWRNYRGLRGMHPWRDLVDWVGGYPFEVARPEQIFDFFRDRGYTLERLVTAAGGIACNEFVFRKSASDAKDAK